MKIKIIFLVLLAALLWPGGVRAACQNPIGACDTAHSGDTACSGSSVVFCQTGAPHSWITIQSCGAGGCIAASCTCGALPTNTPIPTNTTVPTACPCNTGGLCSACGGCCSSTTCVWSGPIGMCVANTPIPTSTTVPTTCPCNTSGLCSACGGCCSSTTCVWSGSVNVCIANTPTPTRTPTPIPPTPTPVCEPNDNNICQGSPHCEKVRCGECPEREGYYDGTKHVQCATSDWCYQTRHIYCSYQTGIPDATFCPNQCNTTGTPIPTNPAECQVTSCVGLVAGQICPYSTPPQYIGCNGRCDDCGGMACMSCPGVTNTPGPGSTNTPTRTPTPTTGWIIVTTTPGVTIVITVTPPPTTVTNTPTLTPTVFIGETIPPPEVNNCNCYAYPTLAAQTCYNSSFACPTPPTYCLNGSLPCTAAGAPALSYPANGAVVTPAAGMVDLGWLPPASWGQCTLTRNYSACAGTNYSDPCIGGVGTSLASTVLTYPYAQSTPGVYYWRVATSNGSDCGGLSSPIRSFRINGSPTIVTPTLTPTPGGPTPTAGWPAPPANLPLVIENVAGTIVLVETGNRNHIVQGAFYDSTSPRRVRFELQISDPDGYTDITSAQMRWNGRTYNMSLVSGVGVGATWGVNVDFAAGDNGGGIYGLEVRATDSSGATTGWVDSGREWKVWDGQVAVAGTLYNGSADFSCSGGFTTEADASMEFTSIIYNWMSAAPAIHQPMTVSAPQNYGSNNLVWNRQYLPLINGGTVLGNINGTLNASGRLTRVVDGGSGTVSCPATNQFSTGLADPYTNTPTLDVDFSFIQNQTPWFQVRGSGAAAGGNMIVSVPVTCANDYLTGGNCAPAISRDSAFTPAGVGVTDDGVIAAPIINNASGCDLGGTCYHGLWRNRWYNGSILSSVETYDYRVFYQNYFATFGEGVTIPSSTTMTAIRGAGIGGTGVVMVNGDVTIDVNHTVPVGRFLLVVASGRINVSLVVSSLEGIFVANQGIGISGAIDNQLVVNGSLYSPAGSVTMSRGYATGVMNNTSPGVVINYRPDFMFTMPTSLVRVLSRWRMGR